MTTLVVPSPVMSSCAVAAARSAKRVGCWICISWSSTAPSFVSLICPAPPTSILSVPRGPKLLFNTCCSPRAAEMLTMSADDFEITSARRRRRASATPPSSQAWRARTPRGESFA